MSKYTKSIKSNFPFPEFRINQEQIIEDVTESLDQITDNFVLESPTGVGKSVISYTAAKTLCDVNIKLTRRGAETGPPILILTSTRQLQIQYIESFKSKNDFNHIWSAKNYDCAEFPPNNKGNIDLGVHFGHPMCSGAKQCPMAKQGDCEYLTQKKKFMYSEVGVTNYSYFTSSTALKPNILICDEAHNLQKILCDKAALSLSVGQLMFFENQINSGAKGELTADFNKESVLLERLFKDPQIKSGTFQTPDALDRITVYVDEMYEKLKTLIGKLEVIILRYSSQKAKYKKQIVKLHKIKTVMVEVYEKYDKYLSSNAQWVYNFTEVKIKNDDMMDVIEVKPLEVNEYFDMVIGRRTKKNLFMSATICGVKQFCGELGIVDWDFKQTNTTIPVENRTVHVVKNLGKLTYSNKNEMLPKFIATIDRILDYLYKKGDGKKVNGIIHTVSYFNAHAILKGSKYAGDMLIPNKEELLNLNDTITNGKANVIVSPSILEGVDLTDDLSRFQIFLKVPYLFLGDVWVKTKMNMNRKWYSRSAIVKIVQGCGRSIRSDEDWAETFILDGNFEKLISYDNELFPEWFKESVRSYNITL